MEMERRAVGAPTELNTAVSGPVGHRWLSGGQLIGCTPEQTDRYFPLR